MYPIFVVDINGDGLADFVTNDQKVYLNVGYGFLDDENWGKIIPRAGISGSVSKSVSGTATETLSDNFQNVCQGSIQVGAGINSSYNQTMVMMADINGDGLPDKIYRDIPNSIIEIINVIGSWRVPTKVSYNLGNGEWSGAHDIGIERFHASTNYSESVTAGLTYGVTFYGTFKATVGVDGSPYSGGVNRDYIQLVDIDADGLPDLVSSDSEDSITVRYNRGGKTNLLKEVINGAGASFRLDYRLSSPSYNQPSRTWLMTGVTTIDTLNSYNGATRTVTKYGYAGPHYDRHERTSYGYDTVTVTQVDPATGLSYRKTERNYYTGNMLRRGKLKRELTYVDSGTYYIEKRHECTYVDYAHGEPVDVNSECPRMSYPTMETTFTTYYEGGNTPKLVVGEGMAYDRYHNVVRYTDMGDTADHSDGLVVTFHYHSGLPHNLIGLRKDYEVTSTGSSAILRKARFEYDIAHGKMTRQVMNNGPDSAVYDFTYDTLYGNLVSAMRPQNATGGRMTFRYAYDSVVHTYPTMVADSYGDTVTTVYDCRFWKPLSVTDPTGSTMTYSYDFAGRLVSVTSPLNTSGTPSLVNEYHPVNYYRNGFSPQGFSYNESPTHHPYAVSLHYDDNGSLITATAVLTNGFGRAIQTKKGLRVGGANMMQVSGRTVVDAFGRTVEQYDPVVEPCTSHWGQYNTGYSAASLTTIAYDVLDRATSTVQPLGVTTTTAYSIDDDRRFVTAVTDPNGNTITQYADYEGRRVKVSDAAGGTTLFAYDALGQLISSTDPEEFSTHYIYDNLGRMTQRDHPDAGVTLYTYDPAGNLITETNPLGQISYGYTYYRPLYKRYSYMTGNNVTYTYGTSGTSKGRPIRITDGTGSLELAYDALGNVTEETRTIVLPQHGEEYRLGMLYQYDSWGRMLSMYYPDGEEITYSYQWGGDLFAMHGEKNGASRTYIRETRYNHLGQKSYMKYGNGSSVYYTYDELHRLANLRSVDRLGNDMQDIDYTFDSASNVTRIYNYAGAVNTLGGAYKNYYTYDALHRLVSSSGAGIGGIYAMDMAYSSSGRIKEKFRDRQSTLLSESVHMFYGYCDAYQPHAVRRIFDEKDTKHYDFRWDAAGNLGQVSVANQDALFESGRFLFWTEDNRMHTAVDEEFYSYYAYDYSGERRIKLTGGNTVLDVNAEMMRSLSTLDRVTLYPSAYMVLNNHGYTKHYYAGAERVAARIGGGDLSVEMAVPGAVNLHIRADSLFWQSLIQMDERVLPENDEGCLWGEAYPAELVGMRIEEIPERMHSDVGFDFGEFIYIMNKMHDYPDESGDPEVYFYHSDHLGSASWITDNGGIAVQHLQYLPYGEPFVDQRMSGYNERFTFTGKERDEETGYGYFGARYMDHELLTSFISVDRYASKYPSISPYAYCGWNPIRLTDPTGDTICINGQHYKPGMSSNGLDEFSKKAVDALNTMYGTDEGRSLIDKLLSSENMFTIEEAATSEFKPLDRRRACLAQLKTDPDYQTEYQGWLDIGFDFNGGSGGTILWNPTGSILPTEKGGQVCATTDLAHEMFHALDADQGMMDYRVEKGISRNDWQAVYHENILRGQMGLPLRTHYRKQMTSNGVFVGGSGEMMISEGKPIRPSWY